LGAAALFIENIPLHPGGLKKLPGPLIMSEGGAHMYKLIQGTLERGYAQGYGRNEAGVHEEVSVPIAGGRPVDNRDVPLESDNKYISLAGTRCESFLKGDLLVVME
jgi:hypothetical protein